MTGRIIGDEASGEPSSSTIFAVTSVEGTEPWGVAIVAAAMRRTAELVTSVAAKKARLDALRPLPTEGVAKLDHYYDLELTYTSNAIEANTLSAVETKLVIDQGVANRG